MAAARRSPRSVSVAADASVPAEAGAHGSALATLAAATAAVGERDRERERDDDEHERATAAPDTLGEDALEIAEDGPAASGATAAVTGRKRKAPTAGFQPFVPEKSPLPPSKVPHTQPSPQPAQQQQPPPQQQPQQQQQQQQQQQRQPAARAPPKEHHARPQPQHPAPAQRQQPQQPQQQVLHAESGSPELSHTATTRMLLNAAAMSGGNGGASAGHGASGVNGAGMGPGLGQGPGPMQPYAYAFAPNPGAFARYDELPPPFGGGARDMPHGGQAMYASPMPYFYNFAPAGAQPGHALFHPLTGMPMSAAHGMPGMFASPAASRPPPGSHQQSPMPPASAALAMTQKGAAASDRAPSDGDLSAAGSAGHDAGGNGLGYRPVTVKTEMLPGTGMLRSGPRGGRAGRLLLLLL